MNLALRTPLMLLLAAAVASSGCSSLSPKSWTLSKAMWWKEQKAEPQMPVRLISTWTDTMLHTPGERSKRGFGGRIMFFNRESEAPVPVDGQLVVYAYDESEGDPSTTRPTRRFIFPAEQFVRHQSEGSLGPSYSVWLPWDDVGGPMKNISLITRFEPKGGPLIIGEQTSHLLPGQQLATESKLPEKSPTGIQLTSFESSGKAEQRLPAGDSVNATKVLKTTSIRLPSAIRSEYSKTSLAKRLKRNDVSGE